MANITKTIQVPAGTKESYSFEQILTPGAAQQVLTITKTRGAGAFTQPKQLYFENIGKVMLTLVLKSHVYSDDVTRDDSSYIHIPLRPGQWIHLPTTGILNGYSGELMDGDHVSSDDWNAPAADQFEDSGLTLGAAISSTSQTTITLGSTASSTFRVGDLIQIGSGDANSQEEILEIKSIDSTTTMTCYRGMYGTAPGDSTASAWNSTATGHGNGSKVYLPFFNTIANFGTYSTASCDKYGIYKAKNLFGKFKTLAISSMGIVPGSLNLKFYDTGHQAIGLNGITLNTKTGLSGGTSYGFSIAVDGGSADDITFTADTTNDKFGGTNGFLNKLKTALLNAENDSTKNMYNKKVIVSLVGGDILLRSAQHDSRSNIVLGQMGTLGSNTELFDTTTAVGAFPILSNIEGNVAGRLPEDDIFDKTTYDAYPNERLLAYDNGDGQILGAAKGTINYETGEISITGPRFGEFVYKVDALAPSAGRLDSVGTIKKNGITDVYSASNSPALNSKLLIKAYN